jgi:hypothetical protein
MRRGLSFAAVAVALGVAGCGGGSSHESSPSPSASTSGSSAASGSRASARPSASRSAPTGTTTSAATSATHEAKLSRAHTRPQVVAGTGGVVVPAIHITIGGGTPLATSSFVAKADAICGAYRDQVKGENAASSLPAQERIYSTIVDDATQALVRLQGLSPPASERRLFTRYLAATGAAIDDFSAAQRRSRSTSEATGTAVDGQDFETFQALAGRVTAARGVAHRLGLRVCGSAGSDWL